MVCLLVSVSILGADGPAILSPGERVGTAVVIHRADILPNQSTNGSPRGGLWPLYSSPEARLNYFAVTSLTQMHFHPDADHRLYVLEGKIVVTCGAVTTTSSPGDFIVIPRGVRHSYDVPSVGDRALLLTFDAPPYDPKKTVSIIPPKADSPSMHRSK
jgi:mannose-6-phosphate isomerase-like protein (cupin superfamily)